MKGSLYVSVNIQSRASWRCGVGLQCGSDLTMYFLTVGGSCDCRSDSEAGVINHAFRATAARFIGDLRVCGLQLE